MSADEAFALACAAYVDADPPDEKPLVKKPNSSRRPAKDSSPPADAAQLRVDRAFLSQKRHILSNLASNACDYSPKGGVDAKCLSLMSVLNAHADYVTTSSCSGRVALFHSAPAEKEAGKENEKGKEKEKEAGKEKEKGKGAALKRGAAGALGWLVVKHGPLSPAETDAVVRLLCGPPPPSSLSSPSPSSLSSPSPSSLSSPFPSSLSSPSPSSLSSPSPLRFVAGGELDGAWVRSGALDGEGGAAEVPAAGLVALKVEPFVMHVACRTAESAKRLLSAAASDAGFRNSGLTPSERRTMCAIRQAAGHGMDVPLVVDGVNYAAGNHAYVRRLLEMASEKISGNDEKIKRLEECVKARLSSSKSA